MSFKYAAIFSRNFILFFALVFFMLGMSKAIANIEIIAPTWEGETLNHIVLDGSDSRQQMLVNYIQADGSLLDKTRSIKLIAEPEGLVSITNGLVEPLSNGKGKIFISGSFNQESTITFEIKNVDVHKQVNFANSVVPLFTKHGCNGGGCHGKSGGQNGFRLSLLGFEPREDFEYLLREARGRRLFPAAPERSLLLLKASGQLPHGGGSRIDLNSFDYKKIVNWMRQGMPYGKSTDPTLEAIKVYPSERVMIKGGQQQLVVLARMTDGSIEDITHSSVYESNDSEFAESDNSGLVIAGDQPGEIAIMRYQD